VRSTQPVEICTRDNHRLIPERHFTNLHYDRQMKQNNNNNVSDFAEKIASSVDGPETEIIIKCGIPRIEAILRVQQHSA